MARIMAIDFGTRRTGIAVSDRSGLIANPLCTVEGNQLQDFLLQYFEKEQVDTIVVGEPKHLNGAPVVRLKHLKILSAT